MENVITQAAVWTSDNGRWAIHDDGRSRSVRIVDTNTGVSYDAIRHDNGTFGFDNASQLPEYVKRAARLALQRLARGSV